MAGPTRSPGSGLFPLTWRKTNQSCTTVLAKTEPLHAGETPRWWRESQTV
jgi:hypothetical protein